MNALSLSVFLTIRAGIIIAPAPTLLTFAPNRSYQANDRVLSAAVSYVRPFIAKVLSDRSFIEDTVSFPHWRSNSERSTMNPGTMIVFLQQESR